MKKENLKMFMAIIFYTVCLVFMVYNLVYIVTNGEECTESSTLSSSQKWIYHGIVNRGSK